MYDAGQIKNTFYGFIWYINSNYAGNPKDCKSIIRNFFFIKSDIVF